MAYEYIRTEQAGRVRRLILNRPQVRDRAVHWCMSAPPGTRVDFKAPKRSLDQNAKMWAMLSEVAQQATHMGRRYSADQWKILFLHALGREVQFIPALDGSTFIPWGQSSSDLSKAEMSDLIELMLAWGSSNGVVFSDGEAKAA